MVKRVECVNKILLDMGKERFCKPLVQLMWEINNYLITIVEKLVFVSKFVRIS